MKNSQDFAAIPMRIIGPIKITGQMLNEEVRVPLATFEVPLWPSVNRGAQISRLCAGIRVTLIDDQMTRSLLLEAPHAEYALQMISSLKTQTTELQKIIENSSRFAKLKDWHSQIVGNLVYIRFAMTTGDAAGHNMTTKACDALLEWILSRYTELKHLSVTGNYCTDKKTSAVNGILGRGKYVVAELIIPRSVCEKNLRTTPEKIVSLNIKKNLIGSIIAGGIRTANAHFANMLLAYYLATGQDAANIVEGSQGIVHAECREEGLYFSVTLPNIIVGAIGNGKQHAFVQQNLELLGCNGVRKTGDNAKRLAAIAAATVLCGELSLLAAQTNRGELTKAHLRLERIENRERIAQETH